MSRLEPSTIRPVLLLLVVVSTGACVPDADRETRFDAHFLEIVDLEDRRAPTAADEVRLLAWAEHDDPRLRLAAIRAIGRLERPAMAGFIAPWLDDEDPEVRATAVWALAQSYQTSAADAALGPLIQRIDAESDPAVRGELARALGRLDVRGTPRSQLAHRIVELADDEASDATLLGVALGLEALARSTGGESIDGPVSRALQRLAVASRPALDPTSQRTRTLAVSALGQARRLSADGIRDALTDPAPQVRSTAARYLDLLPLAQRLPLIQTALADSSALTVHEGVRRLAQLPRTDQVCRYLLAAASPEVTPSSVRIVALDALARPCPDRATQVGELRAAAEALPASEAQGEWQPAAHALHALAEVSPAEAATFVQVFAVHENPFVRVYAARAAAVTGERTHLLDLAQDESFNVRTAALTGLDAIEAPEAVEVAMQALESDDPQLLMAAARILEDREGGAEAAPALWRSFERISGARRETWRDGRRALLRAFSALGTESDAAQLTPYLRDYDPRIAQDVQEILSRWTGREESVAPQPPDPLPLPTADQLRELRRASILLHMAQGGIIEIKLAPYEATTNVWRFVRLVRAGYFDGLTFHRWEPNFVIQGGSPHANEYQGDGPFSRDEVGPGSHWRGTVGISTRGHDTGDAQIFVNLVDNVRLDHAYTIIGTVTRGIGTVDRVLEGGTIERAEVVTGT